MSTENNNKASDAKNGASVPSKLERRGATVPEKPKKSKPKPEK